MIRPTTLVCALLAAGSGLYLYQIKHQAQLLDRKVHLVREATAATLSRAGVMRAEYALLNDPSRLEDLAGQYLPDLKPTLPAQWTSMSELDKRLPPVGAPTADPSPLETEPSPMAGTEPATPVAPPPHLAPIIVAIPATTPRPATAAVTHVVPHPIALAARPSQPAPAVVATVAVVRPQIAQAEPQVPHGHAAAPVFVAQGQPSRVTRAPTPAQGQGAQIYTAAAHSDPYTAPPATTAEAINRITHGGQVDPSVPVVASALGMARTMMAVNPVSQASAATLYQASQAR